MEPRIHTITLAVEDLERALVFYRDGLGLESDGVVGAEFHDDVSGAGGAIAMFRLAGGLVLSLYPRTELAKDAGIPHAMRPPRLARSVWATSWAAGTRWTGWSSILAEPGAPPWKSPGIARGGSTPATSRTPTGTSGRSCTARSWTRTPRDRAGPVEGRVQQGGHGQQPRNSAWVWPTSPPRGARRPAGRLGPGRSRRVRPPHPLALTARDPHFGNTAACKTP